MNSAINILERNTSFRLSLLLLWCLPIFVFGQEKPKEKDTELWTGLELKLNLPKKFTFSLKEEQRFNDDISAFSQFFIQPALGYELGDHFEVALLYRYTVTGKNHEHNEYRIGADIYYKLDFLDDKFKFGYRLRVQNDRVVYTGESLLFLRNKFSLKYKLTKDVKPYFAYESLYRLSDDPEFRGNRFTLGTTWELNKKAAFNFFIRVQDRFNNSQPKQDFIIGAKFEYEIKIKKKKKKRD